MKVDFLFETSWEVCNKVGGINTVIATKVPSIIDRVGENYLLIGPDIWKESGTNGSFREDPELYKEWKQEALEHGVKIRTGYWNIAGEPKVALIDFTPFFADKDAIFAELWEEFKLDSLTGEWDYIEPTIFGYAAAKLIESFHQVYLQQTPNIVAHFHEWMTGSGVLYLKKNLPEVATVFTTHATALGRSLAGNGMALYSDLDKFDPEQYARRLNITSKYSLESLSAKHADSFTTVSGITAEECKYLLKQEPDVITPNGFAEEFVPEGKTFQEKRKTARQRALEVAAQLTGKTYNDDTFLIINSGRYEFKNKGIDLLIEALKRLNDEIDGRQILVYITVPAGHYSKSEAFQSGSEYETSKSLTHYLSDPNNDPILQALYDAGLDNLPDDRIDVIFSPVYLDGNDGVINLDYYDFLIGFDLSVFASYYEPWGYTPMESVAFAIPTVTTNFAGFGDWVTENFSVKHNAVKVVERNEMNDDSAVEEIRVHISQLTSTKDLNNTKEEAVSIYKELLWPKLADHYEEAWEIGLKKVKVRTPKIKKWLKPATHKLVASKKEDRPVYRKIIIDTKIPERLQHLEELTKNLWWTWQHDVTTLFESIDPKLWELTNNNPVELLKRLPKKKLKKLTHNEEFLKKVDDAYTRFKAYLARPIDPDDKQVVYFSMEYALHVSIRTYSGGLGVLAGDYLKQASDSGKNMIAIGLLYRHGYFNQRLTSQGEQIADYPKQEFTKLPYIPLRDENGEWITVDIGFPGRKVKAKAWLLQVGQVKLYLLDTDIQENSEADRSITYELYGGDNEHRLKQELILGVGGIKLLNKLGIKSQVYHCNEGHAAFSCLERIREAMEESYLHYQTAKEVVRANNLFTTHTPVAAGHDVFPEDLIRTYLFSFFKTFQIPWEDFMALGRNNRHSSSEKFSMSVLAANLSQEVNGVSKLHGEVSRDMFQAMYPNYYAPEINIGYVTNGVHYYSWTAEEWQHLYKDVFGEAFESHQYSEELWEKIYQVEDAKVWETKQAVKKQMIKFLKKRFKTDLPKRSVNPEAIINTTKALSENTLIIGFARRFATYKRAHLLFQNLDKLDELVNNENRPVIFVFAGKAHPRDGAGQDFIKRIVEVSQMSKFIGKILFVENYNTKIGHYLTSGVDVWMNTPIRGKEASGTSGEKAVLNGVPNLSVLDGWWAEGYDSKAGWTINKKRAYDDQKAQDLLDAEMLYLTIRNKIVPAYYNRDKHAYSTKWVNYVKNTMALVAPNFTMQRMVDDYYRKYYAPLFERKNVLYANQFQKAKELIQWKNHINHHWESIQIDSVIVPDSRRGPIDSGKHFFAEIFLKMDGLTHNDIGVELVFGRTDEDDNFNFLFNKEMQSDHKGENTYHYQCSFPLKERGVLDYAFRIYPRNELLKYRMDFPLAKWV